MRNIVSISLPDELLAKIKKQIKLESSSSSELIRKALNEYFFKEDFRSVRRKTLAALAEKGVFLTDEDIFREVS